MAIGHILASPTDEALSHYAATNPEAPAAFTLTTTSLLRKYTFLGDLPLTALPFAWRIISALSYPAVTADPKDGTRALTANTWGRYRQTRHAFAQHPSQYTWDRHLYMIMSRYVWFNDLKRVERVAEKQL
jgi:N-acetylglucosaminylphosphatidylinositol deacetylase